jgi:signal transduction histidine kinase
MWDGVRGAVVSHVEVTEHRLVEDELAKNVQALTLRVVEAREQERRHLARELHDEIGQVLSVISINLRAAKTSSRMAVDPRLDESIDIVDQASQQVRNLALDLRPSMLDDLGLVPTLRWFADRTAQRAGFALRLAIESSAPRLSPELTIAGWRKSR